MKTLRARGMRTVRHEVASLALVAAVPLALAVAIPVIVMYGSLRVRMERITVELEAAASQITGYLVSKEVPK